MGKIENQILNRLADGFDDFRERLTRIEESVKPIADLKRDVDFLKINLSAIDQSTKSAHKRIDSLEHEEFTEKFRELKALVMPIVENEKERKKDLKFVKYSFFTMIFGIVGGLITALAKGWL